MKNVKKLIVVALLAGIGQVANGQEANQQQIARDKLQAAVQGICPISGGKLGSMGPPVKVQVGQETIFLCCKGCLQKQINPTHWATIHANFLRAQAKCPIMGGTLKPGAKWTIVQGRIIYVCCPPCIKKIVADPETNLQKVDQFYTAWLNANQVPR